MGFTLRTCDGLDVESSRDFIQYYSRHRMFGWRNPEIHPTMVIPAQVHRVEDDSNITLLSTNPRTYEQQLHVTTWKKVRAQGMGGAPMLGNVPIGDTYTYLYKVARREPAKGFATTELDASFPDPRFCAQFALNKILKLPKLSRTHQPSIPFGSEVLTRHLAVSVYNREYVTSLSEALEVLCSGSKLGVALSPDVGIFFKKGSKDIHVSFRNDFEAGHIDTSHRVPEIVLNADPTGLLNVHMRSFHTEERG